MIWSCGELEKVVGTGTILPGIPLGKTESRDYSNGMSKKTPAKRRSVPDEKPSGRFLVRLPLDIHRQLQEEARQQGISMNTICVVKLGRPFAEAK